MSAAREQLQTWERVTDEEISAIYQANLLTPSAAAHLCGVDVGTLRRWESEGRISAVKTLGGHRRYHRLDIAVSDSQETPGEAQ